MDIYSRGRGKESDWRMVVEASSRRSGSGARPRSHHEGEGDKRWEMDNFGGARNTDDE